ncbi:MAG: DUF5721 family protein, partial [Acetatifactor sp.]
LLAGDAFDPFLLEEAVIKTANTFTIDGRINPEFYREIVSGDTYVTNSANSSGPSEATYEFRPWSEMKGLCFDLIKGRRTPLYFHFVLHLMPEKAESLLAKENINVRAHDVKALILTIRYDGSVARLITGTSYHTFSLSREADNVWDTALEKYLGKKGVGFEKL